MAETSPVSEKRKVKEFPPKQFGAGGEPVFDSRVQIRDEHSGRLVKLQPYARHHMGSTVLFERPIGSGNMFDEKDRAIGNWKYAGDGIWEKASEQHIEAKAHVEIYDQQSGQAKISELEAELAALKAEREPKATAAKPQEWPIGAKA